MEGSEMGNDESDLQAEITRSILVARDRTVLLDSDLAELYGVTTKSLNQAVKRNISRFPSDFAFRLTAKETAVAMSVHVVRAFASLRNVARASLELTQRLLEAEGRLGKHDEDIAALFAAIRELISPHKKSSPGIGF